MTIMKKICSQNLLASAGSLMTLLCPIVVQAEEKTRNLSPVGMAGDVIGDGLLMQSVTGLLIVLATVIGLAWMMRRLGRLQSSAGGALKMLDGMALSTRERIVLVQVGDTQILLGVAPGRVEAVHVLDKPVVANGREVITSKFSTRLKEMLAKEQS